MSLKEKFSRNLSSQTESDTNPGRVVLIPSNVRSMLISEGFDIHDWLDEAVRGMLLVAREKMYQERGGEYSKLKGTNFNPYPVSTISKHEKVSLSRDQLLEIKSTIDEDIRTWKKRIITFGLRAPQLRLFLRYKEGEPYKKYEFDPSGKGDKK